MFLLRRNKKWMTFTDTNNPIFDLILKACPYTNNKPNYLSTFPAFPPPSTARIEAPSPSYYTTRDILAST